jgi:hypothetical protein
MSLVEPSITTDELLRVLVVLTLDDEKRQAASAEKSQAATPTPAALKAQVEAYVRKELGVSYFTCDSVLDVLDQYLDRTAVGVDTWDPDDREKWIRLCTEVSELAGSVVR